MAGWLKWFSGETFGSSVWWFSVVVMAFVVNYFTPDLRAWVDKKRAKRSEARAQKLEKAKGERWKEVVRLSGDPEALAMLRHKVVLYYLHAVFALVISAAVIALGVLAQLTSEIKPADDSALERFLWGGPDLSRIAPVASATLSLATLSMAFLTVSVARSRNSLLEDAWDLRRKGREAPPLGGAAPEQPGT